MLTNGLDVRLASRLERERRAWAAPGDRGRGPAVPTCVDGIAEVAGIVDRHLAQCRRHRRLLAVVCVGMDEIDADAGIASVPAEIVRRADQEMIRRLCARVRGNDLVLCPNERDACVLLPGASADAVRRVAARFRQALDGEYCIDGWRLRMRVRIGSAVHPDDGAQAPEMLRLATGW
jgi:GGDEF domain-containing protein